MKKLKILLFVAGISLSLLASGQVPQMIDYQGMARDGAGNPIANDVISLRLSVWQGPLPGTMKYSEKHTPMTNSYGLFHLMIGDGSVLSGNFAAIDWTTGDYWVQTEIDPAGGNSFVDMGMSKLATVPFAFYAGSAGGGGSSPWMTNGSNIYYNNGNVGIGTDSPVELFHLNADGASINARITSTQSYWQADASGNTGLWFQEGGADVAWLYWNPASQAVFMYENGTQTMAWKDNNVGIGLLDPLVSLQVEEYSSAGVLGSDLGLLSNTTQMLAISVLGISEDNTSEYSMGLAGQASASGSTYSTGVKGYGGLSSSNTYGIYGYAAGDQSYSIAVYGSDGGTASNNYAGYFSGDVHVSGTLSKSGGSFKIDHPLDPENKYLVHSFVESPDMMNIYNGNVTTDADGMAVVELPAYFDALNMEFRYQLTVIGEFAQAIVKEEISGNQFSVQTDKPNVKVSWQVTGVRKDAWAQEHRIKAEIDKPVNEKGLYLHPELYGKSEDMGLKAGMPENLVYPQRSKEKADNPDTEPVLK
ncbi:MAG: hypothetical protein V2I47_09935 [Bacteroidales bacterium]|jgi:hypothetical protein|nr:hypothetical protein [Bacteroidales bacterium]